jgi:hypothetical protein
LTVGHTDEQRGDNHGAYQRHRVSGSLHCDIARDKT